MHQLNLVFLPYDNLEGKTRTYSFLKFNLFTMLLFDTFGAKPFLKWAGGKGQLIQSIVQALPLNISEIENLTYLEPFVGSGAVLFWIMQKFQNIKTAVINDINNDLITAYCVIRDNPDELINVLAEIQNKYHSFKVEEERKDFFLEKRQEFNQRNHNKILSTALLIFLNRTCFNGLYRVNSKNGFNVPFGAYNNPKICDPDTIYADSAILKNVTILSSDFAETINYTGNDCFFYFDPPYKPISKTSNFNSYSKDDFDDKEQERLAKFCRTLDMQGHKWLLSNSDMKNVDEDNCYFDDLYDGFNIRRVKAKRNINSDSSKRGEINELLISNY